MSDYLTRKDIERLTGFSRDFIRRAELKGFKLGKGKNSKFVYPKGEVVNWLKKKGLVDLAKKIENYWG